MVTQCVSRFWGLGLLQLSPLLKGLVFRLYIRQPTPKYLWRWESNIILLGILGTLGEDNALPWALVPSPITMPWDCRQMWGHFSIREKLFYMMAAIPRAANIHTVQAPLVAVTHLIITTPWGENCINPTLQMAQGRRKLTTYPREHENYLKTNEQPNSVISLTVITSLSFMRLLVISHLKMLTVTSCSSFNHRIRSLASPAPSPLSNTSQLQCWGPICSNVLSSRVLCPNAPPYKNDIKNSRIPGEICLVK